MAMFQSYRRPTIVLCLQMLGLLVSCIGIIPWAQSHIRHFEAFILKAWDHYLEHMKDQIWVPMQLLRSLKWWSDQGNGCRGMVSRPSGSHRINLPKLRVAKLAL